MNTSIVVLVVEDEALIQEVVQEALTGEGYKVLIASLGDDAVAQLDIAGSKIRALITDINLPPGTLTGWDVACHARRIIPGLPVVYMSGASGGDWASKGVPNSVLVTKPFAPAQIVTAVLNLLNAAPPMQAE